MIIALFALALAMIVGGLLSMILGWEIVVIERGWTMVLAGSVSAASGTLLFGIAAALSRLASIHDELIELNGRYAEESSAAIASRRLANDTSAAAADLDNVALDREAQPELPFVAPLEEIEREQAPAPSGDRDRFRQDRSSARPEPSDDERPVDISRLKLPDFLLERNRDNVSNGVGRPMSRPEPRVDDFKDYEPEPPAQEALHVDKDDRDHVSDEASQTAPDLASEPEQPVTVIGTYNSGDNRYIMFSDGSIEAETPRGNFRFGSLDELKEFIASGGESGSRTT